MKRSSTVAQAARVACVHVAREGLVATCVVASQVKSCYVVTFYPKSLTFVSLDRT